MTGLVAAVLAAAPTAAFAHTGAAETSGFMHGLAHPVGGLDHVLAMVMVGVLAFQLGGRALWLVPATFVAVMALGGGLGVAGFTVPFFELGIAISVVVLGVTVALGAPAPLATAMGLVGFFAIFHGYAHGAEMPAGAGGVAYGLGFMAGTALLHIAGLGLGYGIGRIGARYAPLAVQATGGVAALAGVGILTGAL
ncbi:HupE/UreJ family protein [Methylobrevis sp. L22]|uniref:HupE/UreJ family protein n=2 Tax=Methylobrevis albus TaxID=2793297 RepID=A0A931HY07_9HYPH|nr:HupE/UreJ family protein [Methylobrevis albus]MBH0236387.1 HupE/UreJ family protein [Methylobrevis albus]